MVRVARHCLAECSLITQSIKGGIWTVMETAKALLLLSSCTAAAGAAGWFLGSFRASSAVVKQLQDAVAHEQSKRAADRAGRIRAEQRLKQLNLQLAQLAAVSQVSAYAATVEDSQAADVQEQIPIYPFAPIGVLRSCFNDRRGTPRQPHLVPDARAALQLVSGVPAACLRGLEGFSHCWVLYVFHENTDLAKLLASRAETAAGRSGSRGSGSSHIKALVSVPRLNGGKMGVLATRSPHRPVPIGLSTAKIVSVDAAAGVLVLGGVDVVDGSPVLDIKPYVPFSDALADATAPDWVTAAADEEPLALSGVNIAPAAEQAIRQAWKVQQQTSLYKSPDQLISLVQQVLSNDIRSLHQRTAVAPVATKQQQQQQVAAQEPPPSPSHQQQLQQQHPSAAGHMGGLQQLTDASVQGYQEVQQPQHGQPPQSSDVASQQLQQYTVTLDGVEVSYVINPVSGHVTVSGAAPAKVSG